MLSPTRFDATLDNLIANGAPDARADETYQGYLVRLDMLGHGFSYSELVSRWSYRKRPPPRDRWHNLVLTLAAANEFRARCRAAGAADGLSVAATYRPIGGARRSQHKTNRAIDLDRIGGGGPAYFAEAVRFWCEYGRRLDMGLGLYTWGSKSKGGIRVHIDTGYGVRSWHGIRSSFGRPYTINGRRYGLPIYLAHSMGLDAPTARDV